MSGTEGIDFFGFRVIVGEIIVTGGGACIVRFGVGVDVDTTVGIGRGGGGGEIEGGGVNDR